MSSKPVQVRHCRHHQPKVRAGPIIEEGEKPFAMLQDLWIKHREWVFEPISERNHDLWHRRLQRRIDLDPLPQIQKLLVIARNRLLPGFRFNHCSILQQLPRVSVVEVFLVGSHQQVPAPGQSPPF